jgi:hypothetical protein
MNNPSELKPEGRKFVNELMNPDQALKEVFKQNNLKRPKGGIVEKNTGQLLTNDGRVVLNENDEQKS